MHLHRNGNIEEDEDGGEQGEEVLGV